MGKSRLLREARGLAQRAGVPVLRGRAVESGGAYRPLVEAFARPAAAFAQDPDFAGVRPTLARMLPSWTSADAVLAPMADPAAVFAEALMMLLQRMAPEGAMLILDDLHWADPDTISVLESMVDSVDTLPLAMVLAARAEPLLPAPLQRLGAEQSVQLVHLKRLSQTDVQQALLASPLPRLPADQLEQLVAVVEGLPLILDELIRQLGEPGSETDRVDLSRSTLAAAVQLRLAGMTRDARLVLDALSVLGETTADVLMTATGLGSDGLADGLRSGLASTLLVTTSGPLGVTWRHHLMADAVRDLLLPLERQAIAHRAADQMSSQTELSDGELRQAASLYELAGYPQQAAELLIRAARAAVSHAALDVADRYLSDAQSLTGNLSRSALDVLTQRLETLVLAGRAGDAYDSGTAALREIAGSDASRLILATARAAFAAGRYESGRELLNRTERSGEAASPELCVLQAQAALAERETSAFSLAKSAAIQAQSEGRFDLACEALLVVGVAARRRNTDEAIAELEIALDFSRSHNLAVWEVKALAELGATDMMAASDATRLEQARVLATDAGMPGTVAKIDLIIAQTIISRQGYRSGYQTLVRADAQTRQLRLASLHAATHNLLAECLLLAGDGPMPGEARSPLPSEVDAVVAEAESLAERNHKPYYLPGIIAVRAWLDGDDSATGTIKRTRWVFGDELKAPPWWGVAALLRVLDGAHPAEAFAPTDLIGHHVNHAAYAYGTAVWALRDGESADRAIEAAELLLEPTPFWRHMLRTVIAPVAREAGIDAVEGWLREADAFCSHTGERHLQRRVRNTLATIGAKVPRTSGGSVPPHLARLGLTAREIEVLKLLNSGLTNTEIAQRLFLSIRTVESHVSNMLQKTGAEGRRQLPATEGEQPVERRS
ncbi:MAG TPA: LuxR C-terminal-related transcriptional regulator [Microlunatus sp.]